MQQNVQKSSRTNLPRRSLSLRGAAVFSQATPPSSSGAGTLVWTSPSSGVSATCGLCEKCLDRAKAAGTSSAATSRAKSQTVLREPDGRPGSGRQRFEDSSTLLLLE